MRAKTNTITINGRTYDTRTGKPVDTLKSATPSAPSTTSLPKNPLKKRSILKARSKAGASEPTIISPQKKSESRKITVTTTEAKKPVTKEVVKETAKAATPPKARPVTAKTAPKVVNRQPQKSQTLMRRAVKKPAPLRKTHAVSGLTAQPKPKVIPGRTNQDRQARLANYTRSSQIQKFASSPSVSKRTAHIPVAPAPTKTQPAKKAVYDIGNTPPVLPASKPRTLREQHRDLFETALAEASSHKAQKHTIHKKRKKSRKVARLAVAAASLVLLVAFFAYQQAPSMALKRASSTIGFTASMPTYRPSGFRISGPVQYGPGRVVIDFRSNSDDRAFTITQATEYADDYSLRNNFLGDKPFEPVQIQGQTGYFYGNANLTWIHSGIWYNIQGYSDLSRDQLLNIASSLSK